MRKGVDEIEAGRMITRIMTSESSSKKPVIIAGYQPTFPNPFDCKTEIVKGNRSTHYFYPQSQMTMVARNWRLKRYEVWPFSLTYRLPNEHIF